MIMKAADIKNVITEIQKHYLKYVNNKYVKKITLNLELTPTTVQNMNLILGANFAYIDSRGAIEDLYYGVRAVCDFIMEIYTKIIPNIDSYLNGASLFGPQPSMNENDKILSQMAIKNYAMNIKILGDMISKLFEILYDFDKINFSKDPAFKRIHNFEGLQKTIEEIKEKGEAISVAGS